MPTCARPGKRKVKDLKLTVSTLSIWFCGRLAAEPIDGNFSLIRLEGPVDFTHKIDAYTMFDLDYGK
jgi:hypothetical protein